MTRGHGQFGPQGHPMDYPGLILCSFIENSIGLKRVNGKILQLLPLILYCLDWGIVLSLLVVVFVVAALLITVNVLKFRTLVAC